MSNLREEATAEPTKAPFVIDKLIARLEDWEENLAQEYTPDYSSEIYRSGKFYQCSYENGVFAIDKLVPRLEERDISWF